MAVRKLSREQFDSFSPARGPMSSLIGEEREWYADERGNVLGVLILDKIDRDWSYVVLGRDKSNKFRGIDVQVSLPTIDAARDDLREAIRARSRSRRRIFVPLAS